MSEADGGGRTYRDRNRELDKVAIARRIKTIRGYMNMTQGAIAELVGDTQSNWTRFEKGADPKGRVIGAGVASVLCDVVGNGLSLDFIFRGSSVDRLSPDLRAFLQANGALSR